VVEDDLFRLQDEGVLFMKRQVATGADVDDGLFRFGFNEEFNPVVVRAEVQKDAADGDEHGTDRDQWTKRIGDDQVHQFAKGSAAISSRLTGAKRRRERR